MVVMVVSFLLALRSMSGYQERPLDSPSTYSLFLVGNPEAVKPELIEKLYGVALAGRQIISFERLFKGSKRALVIFGPVAILQPLMGELKLTELEDYSREVNGEVFAWEVGKKDSHPSDITDFNLLKEVPRLQDKEELWWQIVLQPEKNERFCVTVRAVFKTSEKGRVNQLEVELAKIGRDSGLAFLPQAYSSSQILNFYRERSLPYKLLSSKGAVLELSSAQVYSLLGPQFISSSS